MLSHRCRMFKFTIVVNNFNFKLNVFNYQFKICLYISPNLSDNYEMRNSRNMFKLIPFLYVRLWHIYLFNECINYMTRFFFIIITLLWSQELFGSPELVVIYYLHAWISKTPWQPGAGHAFPCCFLRALSQIAGRIVTNFPDGNRHLNISIHLKT